MTVLEKVDDEEKEVKAWVYMHNNLTYDKVPSGEYLKVVQAAIDTFWKTDEPTKIVVRQQDGTAVSEWTGEWK